MSVLTMNLRRLNRGQGVWLWHVGLAVVTAAATAINCQAEIQPLPLEDIYRVVVA